MSASSVSSSNRFPELDKYELIEEVGHGGMATVYRARDLRLDRDVAVKIIHKHLRENAEVRRRFVAEAKAVAKLRHPAIVEVFDVSDEEVEERYLVVELIRGMSLRQLLADRGVLPAEVAAALLLVLCEAVAHAHDSGVIHRDIKPENVLLEVPDAEPDTEPDTEPDAEPGSGAAASDGAAADGASSDRAKRADKSSARSGRDKVVIKLTDFGIAKLLDVQGVTSTGQILGSPAHMAPEQIEGGDIGPHTDVFALGVLFYECMVGHLPFEGNNPAQVLRRVLDGSFEPADSERPEVGGRWARIVAEALANDVSARVATAAELGQLIAAELAALGVSEPRSTLVDFFCAPAAYRRWEQDVLVPRLVDRGERERKAGRIPGAAADFNRALALKPDDMTILKRVSSLSSETAWKQRISRVGGIAVVGLVLFGVTFGVTKWLRSEPLSELESAPDMPSAFPALTAESSAAPSALPVMSARPDTSPTASAKVSVAPKSAVSAKPLSSGAASDVSERPVTISFYPHGAQVVVDGKALNGFSGMTLDMSVGVHSYSASVPGNCCEPKEGTFKVDAPREGEEATPHHVHIKLEFRPAMFVLNGANSGDTVHCKGAQAGVGQAGTLQLNEVEWRGTCSFSNGSSTGATLTAGETTTIYWPR